MKKSLVLFSTLAAGLLAFGTISSRQNNVVSRAEDDENVVEYSANESKWALKGNSVFNGEMEATNAQFNWLSKKSAFTSASYSTQQNLSLNRLSDWKYEFFTINTSGESGIDGGTGNPTSKNSVSFVWGFGSGTYAKIVERDGEGTVVATKSVGRPGDYTVDDVGDLNCLNSFFLDVYMKPFSVSVSISEKEAGVDFVFSIHAYDMWGAYSNGYSFDLAYSSTNVALKGERYLNVGRAGCGTVGETEKIITKTVVDGAIYSSNSSYWTTCANASFSGSGMNATSAAFDWVSNKSYIDGVDLTTNESLDLVRDGSWKYEYLTISTSGEYGVDAAAGVTQAKNSVSFVWGWIPYAQVVEVDGSGAATVKTVGYEKDIAVDLASEDYALSLFRSTYKLPFNVKVDIEDLAEGVKFNFTISGRDEWGAYPAGLTVSFSYTSTNSSLKGLRSIAYGRIGSGTVDATHQINAVIKVSEVSSVVSDVINYTASEGTLNQVSNATISGKKAHVTATPGHIITNHFDANATIDLSVDYTNVGGSWGGFVVMIKGTSFDYKNTTWSFNTSTNNCDATAASGNWIALQMTHGHVIVYSCVDGVVSEVELPSALKYISGYDYWYVMQQKTDISFVTTDTETGADIKISIIASGHASNTGNVTTATVSIPNTKLHGRQSVGFYQVNGGGTFSAASNNVTIKAKSEASSYANLVKDFTCYADEISATTVTVDTYAQQYNKYAPLSDIYSRFGIGEYNSVDSTLRSKYESLGASLKNVASTNTALSLGANYTLDGTEIVSSTVYIMFGIKTALDQNLSTLDKEYGLQIKFGIKTLFCPFNGDSTKKHVDEANGMTYVIVNFGDCLSTDNCQNQATAIFDVMLYVKASDTRNDTFKVREFSIASMIETYYIEYGSDVVTAVEPIYNHLAANDCFE